MNTKKKKSFLRYPLVLFAVFFATVLMITTLTAMAATLVDVCTDGGLSITCGDKVSAATVTAQGFTASINPKTSSGCNGSTTYSADSDTVTFANNTDTDCKLSFDYTLTTTGGSAEFNSNAMASSGSIDTDVIAGGSAAMVLTSGAAQGNTTTVTITNLYFYNPNISHTVTINPTSNGTVTVNNAHPATKTDATLTVTPAEGYELDTLIVKDANNNVIPVDENNRFKMPPSNVRVTATFKVIGSIHWDSVNTGASILGAQQSNIYFGNYNNNPIKWRVLENTDSELFLLSDKTLDTKKYNECDMEEPKWAKSTIRSWLNGYDASENYGTNIDEGDGNYRYEGIDYSGTGANFIGNAFNTKEQAAINTTNVTTSANPEYHTNEDGTLDKVFLLSIAEATDTEYGFSGNKNAHSSRVATDSSNTASAWWLRDAGTRPQTSQLSELHIAICVNANGSMNFSNMDWGILGLTSSGVRPAFKLNLNSVLFTSPATTYSTNDWKMTLKDSARTSFVATPTAITESACTVSYSGAQTGANEYLSAIIKDNTTNAYTKYARILQLDGTTNGVSGTATINLTGVDMTGKTLYVFNEQCNGDYMTDYASAPVAVSLEESLQQKADRAFATLAGITVADGNTMGAPDVNQTSLLGVQLRKNVAGKTYADGQTTALRYVASLSNSLKAYVDDYGFEVSAPGKEVQRYSVKSGATKQNVISTTTPNVELFTLAAYGFDGHENDNFTVKFYVKKGTEYAYGMYKSTNPDPYALTSNYNAVVALANGG